MNAERLAEIRELVVGWSPVSEAMRELLDHIAQLEAQRGGAVVVPNRSPEEILAMIHRIWDAEPTASNYSLALGVWKEAQASTQPIPASQVLQPGMVGVDREAVSAASKAIDALVVTSWARGDHEEKAVTALCLAFQPIAASLRAQAGGDG